MKLTGGAGENPRYALALLRRIIREHDPDAFVITKERGKIYGNDHKTANDGNGAPLRVRRFS